MVRERLMKMSRVRGLLLLAGLLLVGVAPRTVWADTYTLDGYSINSFTNNDPTSGEFTISMSGGSLATTLEKDLGTIIPVLTLVDTTSNVTDDFNSDQVTAVSLITITSGGSSISDDTFTIKYKSETDPTNAPEPSSLALLAVGLFGLAVGRKKLLA
jgi:hypothetical protein